MLCKCIGILDKDRNIAVINPDIYSPNGYLYNRDSKRPSFFDLTFGMLQYKKRGREIDNIGGYGYIYRPQGCSMILNLRAIYGVGFLDETTFLYCEEIILAERLIKKGYKCACCICSTVIHNHSKTVNSVLSKYQKIQMNNTSYKYYLREYRGFNDLKTSICMLFNFVKLCVLELNK